jgi:predicted dehydrogenase
MKKLSNNKNLPIKIGIIGCGYFGQKRIQACLQLSDDIQIVSIGDIDKNKAQIIGDRYCLKYTSTLEDIYNNSDIEAIIVAVPNVYHVDVASKSLLHGKHVLCEKPLANSIKHAKQIELIALKTKLIFKTGSNHRFFPTVQKAKEMVSAGEIGRLLVFKGNIGTDGSHTKNSWFWDKKISGGGTFIDNGCHLLDIARMFMGDFHTCFGSATSLYWKKAGIEDFATAVYTTKKGSQAIITSSWIQWAGYLYFELWGDDGYIIVDNRGCAKTIVGKKNNISPPITYDFGNQPIRSYHDELLYFVDCIRKNIQPEPSVGDGMKVIQMIDGLYKSNALNKKVHI